MPNWNDVLLELQANSRGAHDHLRLKYLKRIHRHTGRNVLTYYSGWLHKPQLRGNAAVEFQIVDADKTGFMTCSHGVDRKKGLDLILHTPGGDVAATESLIDYLHSLYKGNIRAIVPQLAMSGGTLMALSCRSIIMGYHSSIGPIDPQIQGMPAQGLLEEFERAAIEIRRDMSRVPLWQPIIAKYWPTLITSAQHAIDWSDQLLRKYLTQCMLKADDPTERSAKIEKIADLLGKQTTSKSHNRHINPEIAADLGIKVIALEKDQALQDLVLTLHHAYTHTLSQTAAVKIIENQNGVAHVNQAQAVMMPTIEGTRR
jgi:membrane-bound ClpP family serine protease